MPQLERHGPLSAQLTARRWRPLLNQVLSQSPVIAFFCSSSVHLQFLFTSCHRIQPQHLRDERRLTTSTVHSLTALRSAFVRETLTLPPLRHFQVQNALCLM